MLTSRMVYCGFTDRANIGDFALFEANRQLFGRDRLIGQAESSTETINLFGGGTLFPHSLRSGWYPRRRVNVAVGIGVAPAGRYGYFGPRTTLSMYWWRFRKLGVRGPRSQRALAHHGLGSTVTGDTALALRVEAPAGPSDAVGICVVGEAMARRGAREAVRREVVAYGRRLAAEGLRPVFVPFCSTDLEWSRALCADVGGTASLLDFWAPPVAESLDEFLRRLSTLRFMVAERLHASVLAAVAGVPFLTLPYKSKCFDFLETVSRDPSLWLDYERLTADGLWRATRQELAQSRGAPDEVAASVERLRGALTAWASEIEATVEDAV